MTQLLSFAPVLGVLILVLLIPEWQPSLVFVSGSAAVSSAVASTKQSKTSRKRKRSTQVGNPLSSTTATTESSSLKEIVNLEDSDAYDLLASAISPRMTLALQQEQEQQEDDEPFIPLPVLSKALKAMARAQAALKTLDGAAYEAYQRTHSSSASSSSSMDNFAAVDPDGDEGGDASLGKVAGRASRSARRAGCAADALLACELCELASRPDLVCQEHALGPDGTLDGREILVNVTLSGEDRNKQRKRKKRNAKEADASDPVLSILVLYEREYNGGAGMSHGGIDDLISYGNDINNEDDSTITQTNTKAPRGRILVIVRDSYQRNLPDTLRYLDASPRLVSLRAGLVAESASVHHGLYRLAGKVIAEALQPALQRLMEAENASTKASLQAGKEEDTEAEHSENEETNNAQDNDNRDTPPIQAKQHPTSLPTSSLPAIHFVGHSLGGAVAGLAAAMLDGTLPFPKNEKTKRKHGRPDENKNGSNAVEKETSSVDDPKTATTTNNKGKHGKKKKSTTAQEAANEEQPQDEGNESAENDNAFAFTPIHAGYGRGRCSAVTLGSPPCLSPNVRAAFVTSVVYGDDVVCRTTRAGLDRLCGRAEKYVQRLSGGGGVVGGLLGKVTTGLGGVTDAVSLTVSNIKSHARGSEGEESKLSLVGNTYLVRPRRLGGGTKTSMHEIGGTTGREALRAAVLWQLNDVLLSSSLWKHHGLLEYIKGLDRVQLRSLSSSSGQEEEEDGT